MAARRALILLAALAVLPSLTAAQQTELGAAFATLANFRDQLGKRLTYVCPPGEGKGQVYGTDVYTDDSSICGAAVHAGVITFEKGGPVTVVIKGEQQRYTGSTRNGVTTADFGAWAGSFSFDRRGSPARIAWSTTAKGVKGYTGSVTVICPEGGKPRDVWGTDSYTGDSSICSAAAHAGVITPAKGGPVTLLVTEGQRSYKGTSRNGVTSREYGSWDFSFQVSAGGETLATAPVGTTATLDSSRVGVTTTRTGVVPLQTAETLRIDDTRSTATSPSAPAPTIVSATGFKGVAGPGYSQLSWNAAPGSIGYGLTRYDPTTQQRITLRPSGGDTVFAQTAYTDTAVTPNRTYGYRLRTFYHDENGDLVSDPDTSQGAAVTPKDPSAPLALPPDFQDSVKIQFSFSPPDPNRPYPQKGDTMVTLSWDWRTGAQGFRINVVHPSEMTYLVGTNGAPLDEESARVYGKNSSQGPFIGPYASTRLQWPKVLRAGGYYMFCVFAASPIDPTTGKRVESRPGMLKLINSSYSTGGKWEVEKITYYGGQNSCPTAPSVFLTGK